MNNAVYAAATGLLNRARVLDVTGNNLANASTAGFKRERLITSSFNEQVVYRLGADQAEIGNGTHGCMAEDVQVDVSQGTLESTGRTLDVAIRGDGYFSVQDANGGTGLTRNGSFQIGTGGYLVTASGAYVMGQGGRIQVGAGEITIGEDGQISVDGRGVGTLTIVVPGANATLTQQANGLLANPGNGGQFTGALLQGYLERANVNMVEEMTAMMEASRAFQSCGQVLRILDTINEKTANEVGHV